MLEKYPVELLWGEKIKAAPKGGFKSPATTNDRSYTLTGCLLRTGTGVSQLNLSGFSPRMIP